MQALAAEIHCGRVVGSRSRSSCSLREGYVPPPKQRPISALARNPYRLLRDPEAYWPPPTMRALRRTWSLIDRAGRVVYRGAIDRPAIDPPRRRQTARNYVRRRARPITRGSRLLALAPRLRRSINTGTIGVVRNPPVSYAARQAADAVLAPRFLRRRETGHDYGTSYGGSSPNQPQK